MKSSAGFLPPLRRTAASTIAGEGSPGRGGEDGAGGGEGHAVSALEGEPPDSHKQSNRCFFDKSRLVPSPPPQPSPPPSTAKPSSSTADLLGRRSYGQALARSPKRPLHGASTKADTSSARATIAGAAPPAAMTTSTALLPLPSSLGTSSSLSAPPPHQQQVVPFNGGQQVQPSFLLFSLPVREWTRSVMLERESGRYHLDLARALFQRVVLANPQCVKVSFGGATEEAGNEKATTAVEQFTMLATRAAVCSLLLQEAVLSLPRHQRMLEPYVKMLLQAVYVPNANEEWDVTPALDDGTLEFPTVLDGLREAAAAAAAAWTPSNSPPSTPRSRSRSKSSGSHSCLLSSTGATVAAAVVGSGRDPREAVERSSVYEDDYLAALLASGGEGPAPHQLAHLLSPFARKPFFIALLEVARRVTAMAHKVRSQQLHMQKLPLIFAMTHVSWTKTLLRTVMRAWRKLCMERHVQLQKHRARWAQRWSRERVRIGIRRWRGIAAYMMQIAEADSTARAAITEKKECIRRYLMEVEGLQKTSRVLSLSFSVKEEERKAAKKELVEMEYDYMLALHRVREVDRVGTVLLDYLLLPPTERNDDILGGDEIAAVVEEEDAGQTTAAATAATTESEPSEDFMLTLSARYTLGVRPLQKLGQSLPQQHCIGALRVLVEWANRRLLIDGKATEELCAMSPTAADKHLLQKKESAMRDPSAVERAEAEEAVEDENVIVMEPVFTQLFPSLSGSFSSGGALLAGDEVNHDSGPGVGDGVSGPNAFVPVPFYKYLVLMRCFMQVPTATVAAATAAAADGEPSASPPVAALDAAMVGGKDGGFQVHPNAPAVETVRMVKTADAAVLECLCSLYELAHQRALGGGGTADGGGRRSPQPHASVDDGLNEENLVSFLPEDMRAAAEDVARILVDSYERLTGTACVVTAQQLLYRGRGVQLVFLAALFRHYTNWSVRRSQVEEAALGAYSSRAFGGSTAEGRPSSGKAEDDGDDITAARLRSLTVDAVSLLATQGNAAAAATHLGRRHMKYTEWFSPPATHLQWPARVVNQRSWVAFSLSALHRALYENTRLTPSLSVEEQDLAVSFVRSLTFSRLVDVLPLSPELSAEFYMSLVKVVEQNFSHLWSVFLLYAIPFHEVKAARRAAEADANPSAAARRGGRNSLLSSDDDDSDSGFSDASSHDEESDGGHPADAHDAEGEKERRHRRKSQQRRRDRNAPYITANGFWHLLCDARVAGGQAPSGEVPRTLHRAAVFSIIEHVVLRPLDPCNEESEGKRAAVRSDGHSSSLDNGTHHQKEDNSSHKGKKAAKPRERRARQVGTQKIVPYFARAIQEERHVDLRYERATICMSASQFAEAVVRCAHYWQAIQSDVAVCDGSEESKNSGESPTISRSNAGSCAPSTRGSPVNARPRSKLQRQQTASNKAATSSAAYVFVKYESLFGECPPLNPQLLDTFLADWILPHCLAGPGGTSFTKGHRGGDNNGSSGDGGAGSPSGPIAPFRRAIRQRGVQRLLAIHQEDLFKVFSFFSKPREAFGIRGALPPPYSYATHHSGRPDQLSSSSPNGTSQRQQRQRASLLSNAPSSTRSSCRPVATPLAGKAPKLRDVGIVALMSFTEVEAMAKGLRWKHLSSEALHHCFTNVIVDSAREKDVIFFTEFLDYLCAVASYSDVNPMTPLVVKLERFLVKHVLPALEQT